MKTKKITFPILAMLFVACGNNDIPQVDILKDTPITIKAEVTKLNTRAGYETPEKGAPVLPQIFYLNIDQEGSAYDYSNILLTGEIGSNAYTPASQLLWAGAKDVNVVAATFKLDGAQTLEVQKDQSEGDAVKASDHLYMPNQSITPSMDGIYITFSHIMSKVNLSIILNNEFSSINNPITNVTFMGTVTKNSYNAGTWANVPTNAITTDVIAWEGTYINNKAQYEVILVPQTVAAKDFIVQFTIGERTFKWISENAVQLNSGTQYQLELTMKDNNIDDATFTAKAWSENNSTNIEAN